MKSLKFFPIIAFAGFPKRDSAVALALSMAPSASKSQIDSPAASMMPCSIDSLFLILSSARMRTNATATWSATAFMSERSSSLKVSLDLVPKESVPIVLPSSSSMGWQA